MTTVLHFILSFFVSLLLTIVLLPILKRLKVGQEILQYVTEHSKKQGTPTMGGVAFIVTVCFCGGIFCDKSNKTVWVAIAVFFAYGVIGFLDDFIKVKFKRNLGLLPYQKIISQLAVAVLVSVFAYNEVSVGGQLSLPFSEKTINIGGWIIPLAAFVFLACSNGVNLTDGIDGLATSTTISYLIGIVLLLEKERIAADSVGDTYAVQTVEQLSVLCVVAIGALCAFLIFNVNDAKIFMGDTGSLALGALVASVSIFSRMTLFVPIIGVMFVVSCVSVIVQVGYYKLSDGKRVFLMAPFHHHLQKKKWSESRICVLYCVVTMLFILVLWGFA